MLWSLFPQEPARDKVLRNVPSDHAEFTASIASGADMPTKAVRRILKKLAKDGFVACEQSGFLLLWRRTT